MTDAIQVVEVILVVELVKDLECLYMNSESLATCFKGLFLGL